MFRKPTPAPNAAALRPRVTDTGTISHRIYLQDIDNAGLRPICNKIDTYDKVVIKAENSHPLSVDGFEYARKIYGIMINRELNYRLSRMIKHDAEVFVNSSLDSRLLKGVKLMPSGGDIQDCIDISHNRMLLAIPEYSSSSITIISGNIKI